MASTQEDIRVDIPMENPRASLQFRMRNWIHVYFHEWFLVATILDLLLLTYIAFHKF